MKRFVLLLILISFLSACSVQEKMSPEIFIERLTANDERFLLESFYADKDNYFCFGKYDDASVVLKISADKEKNVKKINLSCVQNKNTESFISCAERLISIYSPNDNSTEIIKNLFFSKTLQDKCVYYETQWYMYSSVCAENGFYFSAENKKISPHSDVELSLKQNDITEY